MNVYYHRGAMGDIIQSLPTVRILGRGVYQTSMRRDRHDSIATLLKIQRCIEHTEWVRRPAWNALPPGTTHDLNRVFEMSDPHLRQIVVSHAIPHGVCLFQPWRPWLDACPTWTRAKYDRTLINRTFRYRNPRADWRSQLGGECLFVGQPDEHADFQSNYGPIPYLPTANCYELAKAVYESTRVACSQSLVFTLALGYGVPHTLETAPGHTNCIYNTPTQTLMPC